MPLLAREGSIIAYGSFERDFEYDYLDRTRFVIYNLPEGRTAHAEIYDLDGKRVFGLTARNDCGVISWSSDDTDRTFTVEVVND